MGIRAKKGFSLSFIHEEEQAVRPPHCTIHTCFVSDELHFISTVDNPFLSNFWCFNMKDPWFWKIKFHNWVFHKVHYKRVWQ